MGISQDPAGSRGTPGEYGNFTRRSVEDAAPYKARVFDRQLVRVGSASPRLPRPLRGLAMTTRLAASLNFSICLSLHNLNPPAPAEYRI